MQPEEKEIELASWNLAQALIIEISQLLQRASSHYIKLDYPKAYFCLKAVRFRISPNLDKEEKIKLKKLEAEMESNLGKLQIKSFDENPDKEIVYRKVIGFYGDYNDDLMLYLKKYGFFIPPKKDSTLMNA